MEWIYPFLFLNIIILSYFICNITRVLVFYYFQKKKRKIFINILIVISMPKMTFAMTVISTTASLTFFFLYDD